MRRILTITAAVALALGTGIWLVLISIPTAEIHALNEHLISFLFVCASTGALAGLLVALFGDLDCLRFYGAVATIIALLGLAALYSAHRGHRDAIHHSEISMEVTAPVPAAGDRR